MASHDKQGRPYIRICEAVEGQTIWLDGGFTCRCPGKAHLHRASDGAYFECQQGHHFLDGQDDGDGFAVGVYIEDPGPLNWQQEETA